jgi:hypothetical protein
VVSESSGVLAKTFSLSGWQDADGHSDSSPADAEHVTVTLGTASEPMTDFAGNALAPSSAWSFTVHAWLPLGGASAPSPVTSAENVTMKVGTDGYPVIAWAEFDGSSKNIHVQRWNGLAWSPSVPGLSAISGPGTNSDEPDLVLDFSNRPIIDWQELSTSTGPTNIYARSGRALNGRPPLFDNVS